MPYLDHNATTDLHPAARAAMTPWLGPPANPSSAHAAGRRAWAALEAARAQVAALVGADPADVVFTSGATEANHHGLVAAARSGPVALSPLAHPSLVSAARAVGDPRVLRLDGGGRHAFDGEAAMMALTACCHETGLLVDVQAARAAFPEAWLHVDAVQALARGEAVPYGPGGADSVALSGHKLGAPVGIGALVVRGGRDVPAWLPGAQERGRRGGTTPVALAVALGAAAAAWVEEREAVRARWAALTARLEAGLAGVGARVVGAGAERAPGVTALVIPGWLGEDVVMALDLAGVCVSAGAACASGAAGPSPALVALGDPDPRGLVRVSLGRGTEAGDVDVALAALRAVRGMDA